MKKTVFKKERYDFIKQMIEVFVSNRELLKVLSSYKKITILSASGDLKGASCAHLIYDILSLHSKAEIKIKHFYQETTFNNINFKENIEFVSNFYNIEIARGIKMDVLEELDKLRFYNRTIREQKTKERFRHLRQNIFLKEVLH